MAEPYDTINAIGNGPRLWYRFSAAAAPIPNEGTDATAADLTEVADDGANPFNGTYRYEVNPVEDGYGLLLNGAGGLIAACDNAVTQPMTMMMVTRSDSVGGSLDRTYGLYLAGIRDDIDVNYNDLWVNGSSGGNAQPGYHVQNTPSDDSIYYSASSTPYQDGIVHSAAVVGPSTAGTPTVPDPPLMYVDGDEATVVANPRDLQVPDNHGPHLYNNDELAIGINGGTLEASTSASGWIFYEFLVWDEQLEEADILLAHVTLTTPLDEFSVKTIRRTNRKLYYDFENSPL